MNIEETLKLALGGLVGGRIYPTIFPQAPATPVWPAIRYVRVSTSVFEDLCGEGDDDSHDVRVQLDIVAEGFVAARTLRDQVRIAMKSVAVLASGEFQDFDPETKTHRRTLDYIFYESSGVGADSPP
jgi:hypothetical protein